MRDGNFAYIMQQQEADKAQKSLEKEKWAMSSTKTEKDLLLIHHVLSLQQLFTIPYPRNWASPHVYSIYKAVFRAAGK